MSTPLEQIQDDLKKALKAKDKERLSTLRLLLAEIKNEKIRAGQEVGDDAFARLVRKAIKQRKDSAEQYRKGNRAELAAKEEREAAILGAYLPQQVGADEIQSAIEELVAAEGLEGPRAMGVVMKAMMARFGGSADGKTVNQIARKVLAG